MKAFRSVYLDKLKEKEDAVRAKRIAVKRSFR